MRATSMPIWAQICELKSLWKLTAGVRRAKGPASQQSNCSYNLRTPIDDFYCNNGSNFNERREADSSWRKIHRDSAVPHSTTELINIMQLVEATQRQEGIIIWLLPARPRARFIIKWAISPKSPLRITGKLRRGFDVRSMRAVMVRYRSECNCSGRSDDCAFDMEQYRSTGSGGRCVNCRDNTDGPHCERCRENHYRRSAEEPCLPCNCNINGSVSLQCDVDGRCACRAGVTGEKCDTCRAGFHSLGPGGCRPCECDPDGSVDDCSSLDGRCYCKPNVEGQSCDSAQHPENKLERSVRIRLRRGYDQDGWSGEFSGGQEYPLLWKEGEVFLLPLTEEDIGFYKAPVQQALCPRCCHFFTSNDRPDRDFRIAHFNFRNHPSCFAFTEKFLGHQVYSYNQLLSITFTSETVDLLPNNVTLLLQGSGFTLSADLSPQPVLDHDPSLSPRHSFIVRYEDVGMVLSVSSAVIAGKYVNPLSGRVFPPGAEIILKSDEGEIYGSAGMRAEGIDERRRLHENEMRFKPALSAFDFQRLLYNLTAVSISNAGGHNSSPPAPWVESCSCPPGFAGQFCERCAPGFTREDPGRGTFSTCVPCNCHRHGTCHPETGWRSDQWAADWAVDGRSGTGVSRDRRLGN
ncbi:Laminin subunit gamma-3 [Collichthys lucidus]|uniref:Laminin subunit gamma-3 n=1 Tax=Collichthys lucidus TaxID=240159 RepID=A0A4U5VAA7_COLLU|nr:Laminin subunit gamma-3 [Collichthys lucidus]